MLPIIIPSVLQLYWYVGTATPDVAPSEPLYNEVQLTLIHCELCANACVVPDVQLAIVSFATDTVEVALSMVTSFACANIKNPITRTIATPMIGAINP